MSLILSYNNVNCYVKGDGSPEDNAQIANLSHCLSYSPKGGHFSGITRAFSMFYEDPDGKYSLFPAGLVDFVLHTKHKRHPTLPDGTLANEFEYYAVEVGRVIDNRVPIVSEDNPISLYDYKEQKPLVLHDYQVEALDAFKKHRRGIIRVSMGGGKTVLALALTQRLGLKTLFVVNNKTLVRDTIREYKKVANIVAGQIGDGEWNPAQVTVSTIQTLSRRLKEKYVKHFLSTVNFVIWDEGQHASRTYQQVSRALKNAYYRVSFSATVGMGGKEEKLKSMSLSGPMIYDVEMKRLVDNKQLAKPTAIFIRIPRMDGDPHWPLMSFEEQYDKGIVHNEFRNMILSHAVMEQRKRGFTSLLLVEKLDQGHNIMEVLGEYASHWKVQYISGNDDTDARDDAKVNIQTGELDVLVTSRIFNEGVDLPGLESVVVGSGYKSPGLTYQRAGRGVRKTPIKDWTTIFDCYDEFAPKLFEHSQARYKTLKKNKAFDVLLIEWNQLEKTLDELAEKRRKPKLPKTKTKKSS